MSLNTLLMGALNKRQNREAFTLLELLIVIGIIAILAAALYVALNPAQRFQESRNARRWADVQALIKAITIDQVDNKGSYFSNLASNTITVPGTTYQITNVTGIAGTPNAMGTPTNQCNTNCAAVTGVASCLNFNATTATDDLIDEGYISQIPVAPPTSTISFANGYTGYYITKRNLPSGVSTITIGSCVTEGQTISISQ